MKLDLSEVTPSSALCRIKAIQTELQALQRAFELRWEYDPVDAEEADSFRIGRDNAKDAGDESHNLEVYTLREPTPSLPDPLLLERIIRGRRKRSQFFGNGLFSDPAWDMMLDLAVAQARNRRVSVTSLCIASGVPSTTALRWIGMMVEEGLFQREDDIADRRRTFVSLSREGIRILSRYFTAIEADARTIL